METTSFRQFLESFCSDSPWSYAVFWKLQHFQDQTLLIYEDGYYDYNVLQLRTRSKLKRFSGAEDVPNLKFVTDLSGKDEYPIAFANDVLSCHRYLLGQGVVGRVALSGNDLWLHSYDTESIELMLCLEHHFDEWLLPVSTGIKTTLITPIFPYGILQLGSFEKVAENYAYVAEIKERIFSLMSTPIYMPFNYGETTHIWSILMSGLEEKDESSPNPFHGSNFQCTEEFDIAEFADIDISTGYEIIEPFKADDISRNSLLTSDMDTSHLYLDLSLDSDTHNEFVVPDIPETLESMWTFTCHEEEYVCTGISSESSSGASSYVVLDKDQQSPETENDSDCNHKMLGRSHPEKTGTEEAAEKTFSLKNGGRSSWSFEANVDSCKGLNLSEMSSCGWFDEGGDHDYLLEAAVASLYENSDATVSCMFSSSKSTVTSSEKLTPSFLVETLYETSTTPTEHETIISHGQCMSLSRHHSTALNNLTSVPIFKDEQPIHGEYGVSHDNEKIPKKKVRAGSKVKLRPRPRDRQLIQDRLKQLRKLVPTGTKSSIDGLLEQTTKHMMFLRSVTEQAKKVNQFKDQKLIADKKEANTGRPCRSQQGGNNTECPIIVTDMENPGQFLIQMLCNSNDVFFEMIEVMRQLNLSILQGVMESDCNNWARFIVEASEDFNKLDIFWPLMRILQRNGDWMTKMNQWCT